MNLNTGKISELSKAFQIEGNNLNSEEISDGHINNTYRVDYALNDGSTEKYLIQKLNTNVFRRPVELMENIVGVTEFIKKKIAVNNGNVKREVLNIRRAENGLPYYIDSEGGFWRCYDFIDGAHSIQTVENAENFRASAVAFGTFQNMLSDYPAKTLHETIPDFHNTLKRYGDFCESVKSNKSCRAENCPAEIEFIKSRENIYGMLVKACEEGRLPVRVTHNDTKLNNVLFDNETDKALCVVDLDTVMPGLSLYDFGDSIRFGASTAAEDEKDLDKVHFCLEYFEAYTDGFLCAAGNSLTDEEMKNLPLASIMMTLECGMRFLADYIDGDVYFKTDYPEHNLVRAHTQLKLASEMEEQMNEMEETVIKIRRKYSL